MAQKGDFNSGNIFTGLMRKTQVFRTKLRKELGFKIVEFAPTKQDIIFYCDEWLGKVIEDRNIGGTGKYVDDDLVDEKGEERLATETEIIEDMIEFLDSADCEKEIYQQIDRNQQPTMVNSEGSHYFDEPYGSEIPVYMNDIFVLCGGDKMYYGTDGEFLLMFLKEEVEGIINKTMREHLSDKLPKKE